MEDFLLLFQSYIEISWEFRGSHCRLSPRILYTELERSKRFKERDDDKWSELNGNENVDYALVVGAPGASNLPKIEYNKAKYNSDESISSKYSK